MTRKKYRIGSKCTTGQVVASILGQSDDVVVYTTTDNHLRWDYNADGGKVPTSLLPAITRFDALMTKIADTPSGEAKKQLYYLLGKCLFAALDSRLSEPLKSYFKPVEELLKAQKAIPRMTTRSSSRRVFIAHGHDEAAKQTVARFLEHVALQPIILHEQPDAGRTIIEKFETESEVSFAVVLLTPDDMGYMNGGHPAPRPRARQNVVFELGFFVGRLGRGRVTALYKEGVEIPSDYRGVAFTKMDDQYAWKMILARELKQAGIKIDLNKAIS
jgi:predicted nucleotide-binding protein